LFYIILCFFMAGCAAEENGIPSLRETYSYTDTKPFGGAVAFSLLHQLFPGYPVNVKKEGFDKTVAWFNDKSSIYICITRYFFPTPQDKSALLDFIASGNTVLLSASLMDSVFLAQLNCKLKDAEILKKFAPYSWQNTFLKSAPQTATDKESFGYFYLPFESSLKLAGSNYFSHKISLNHSAEPNAFLLYWGKGKLILHSEPRALSNYFLLSQNNHLYFKQLMQLMPAHPENIYWDDFYRRSTVAGGQNKSGFSLAALMANPPLKWAFLISLFLLFLYLLVNGKRRQRIVPVIPPVENSSIKFAQAVAGIYLNDKDNKGIAEKMITYFSEFIRNQYYINLQHPDAALADKLSKKSGVPFEKVRELCLCISAINARPEISDELLLELNQHLQYFHKNKL